MSSILKKIASGWKSILIFICLFIVIFTALAYVLIWRTSKNPAPQNVSINPISAPIAPNPGKDFKDKMGLTDISYLNYGEWSQIYGVSTKESGLDLDLDGDGLPNYLEYAHGTDPKNPDSDGDKFTDRQEITNGYDPDAPGDAKPVTEITISKIGVKVPMIWSLSTDEKAMLSDLEKGASHYPKTASPGQTGNMIVSGHSSNTIWAMGDYNNIFRNLNDLEAGDEINIKTIQRNGRVLVYHYAVTGKKTVFADDPYIFENSAGPTVTLSTCWPLGTAWKRLIIKAQIQ